MSGPIGVDLAGAQECKAVDMIRFLLAFSRPGVDKTVPVCDEDVLGRAFSRAKEVANQGGTALRTNLDEL